MALRLSFIVLFSLLLFSCTQNTKTSSEFGTVDSLSVAADTTMQLGIESSYEFHKTVVAADTLVYDVVGYGGSASAGELAILRRGANNKADTVLKQTREGVISDVVLKGGELNILLQNPKDTTVRKVLKYHIDPAK